MLSIIIVTALFQSLSIFHLEWGPRMCKDVRRKATFPYLSLSSSPALSSIKNANYILSFLLVKPFLQWLSESLGWRTSWLPWQPRLLSPIILPTTPPTHLPGRQYWMPLVHRICLVDSYLSLYVLAYVIPSAWNVCIKTPTHSSFKFQLKCYLFFLPALFYMLSFYFEYTHESCSSCFVKWLVCQSASLLHCQVLQPLKSWLYVFPWWTGPGLE